VTVTLSLMIPFLFYQLGDSMQVVFANSLRAIEDVKPLVWYAFIAYILVSIPVSYLFAFVLKMGPQGVWWGFPFGLTTAGLLFFQRFYRKTKTEK
jgi:MATE family multidrug resistance protein